MAPGPKIFRHTTAHLPRTMFDISIVLNFLTAYLFQPYNATPITSWFNEKNDRELSLLRDFLKQSYHVRNIYNDQ